MKKQEFKKMRTDLGTSRTTLNVPTSKSQGARRRIGRARNGKLTRKHSEGKLPQSGKGNRLPGSPGSSERSPKEVGPKEAHAKAHHNYITQGKR